MTRLAMNYLCIPCLMHFSISFNCELGATTCNPINNIAPRKMKQVAPRPTMVKNMGVRVQAKRVKAEMGKIKEEQQRIREEQRRIRVRFGEVRRQCDQLKEETEMIVKQTAKTQIKIVLMFKILKARKSGDFTQAATLTQCLREFVTIERANASLIEVKKEHP